MHTAVRQTQATTESITASAPSRRTVVLNISLPTPERGKGRGAWGVGRTQKTVVWVVPSIGRLEQAASRPQVLAVQVASGGTAPVSRAVRLLQPVSLACTPRAAAELGKSRAKHAGL
eukprot:3294494-Pleurochrysis_carterae.AAC.3